MNRLPGLMIASAALLSLGVAFPAKAKTLKGQLVGTWTLVSLVDQYQDGRKDTSSFGPDLKGVLMLDRTGRFSLQLIGGDRPKTVGNPRNPVGPAIAYFGTYSLVEGKRLLTCHVERSTYPPLEGTDQTATITIKGDKMTYVRAAVPSPAGPFVPILEWKRVK